MMRMTMLCAVVLAMATGAIGEMVDNPAYQSWAAYKPGTAVTVKAVTKSGEQTSEMTMVGTLKAVTPEKVTVETTVNMVIQGKTMKMPAQTMNIPAKIEKSKLDPTKTADAEVEKKELGEETVKVAGKTYKCKVTQTTSKMSGITTVSKAWTCKDMPGQMVKTEATMTGAMTATSTMTVSEVKLVK